ncbi:pikachurin-like isoform X2 [Lytechinus variegatus]|uniref:pikachurin-like isoform X2 n=1 Tax=Lytechinus variegatus TaxID=7654 RepID=UPI001BB28EDB|nr:pikachurin-like isoform X2 [Lytechinus variegatus]
MHPCSQICIETSPHRLRCDCTPGNVLSGNGFLCLGETIDIDSEVPTTDGILTDDEDMVEGSGSGDGEDGGEGPPDQTADLTCDDWPCENGGTCYIVGDTPMCTCTLGWEGAMCEEALKIRFPRFYGNSYLSMPVPAYKLYQSFFITISFKPESLNGRLLFASQEEDGKGDYIAIGLVNGKAVFRFDCGQGAAVITSENSVSLYKWHTLKIGRDHRKGWLQLDDAQIVRGSTPGVYSKVTLRGDLFVGGYNVSAEIRDGLRVKHMFEGFRGCIESIDIANMDLDLRPQPKGSMVGGQNVGECSEGVCKHHVCTNGGSCISRSPDQAMCLCPLGTHGSVCEDVIEIHTPSFNSSHSSHIAHDTLGKKHLSFLQMEIIFKPKEPSGILIYSGTESRDGDFFSITLDENYIGFKFDCGSGPAVLRSTQPVTLHEWHIVEVSRTAREGMLRVDNQPTVTALAPGAFTQTSFDTNLYIGGIDDIDLLSREVAVKNSFSGDIQRVLVNDNQLDLISEAVGGANVGNAHHPCQGQPCLNNGECHPLHENYLCDCRLGFMGDNCEIEIEEDVSEPSFTGRSYLWYASNEITSRLSGERNIFSFELRATEPNGLVLWAGHSSMTSGSDFIAMGLEDGLLLLRFDLGGGEAVLRSRRPVNDGEWHVVRIDRLGIVGIMEVDNDDAVTNQATGEDFRQLNVNDGLYLGGMDDIGETTMNLYTTGLTGCLRNFKIDQSLKVFSMEQPDGGRSIRQCS